MKKITINTPESKSDILIGENWESVTKLLPENSVVIITDENVKSLYGDGFPDVPVFVVSPGEESKTIKVVEGLATMLLNEGIDRTGFILAVGGGGRL